jgi:hypothetical protein
MLNFKSSKTLPALGSIKCKLKSLADNTYFVASATEMNAAGSAFGVTEVEEENKSNYLL